MGFFSLSISICHLLHLPIEVGPQIGPSRTLNHHSPAPDAAPSIIVSRLKQTKGLLERTRFRESPLKQIALWEGWFERTWRLAQANKVLDGVHLSGQVRVKMVGANQLLNRANERTTSETACFEHFRLLLFPSKPLWSYHFDTKFMPLPPTQTTFTSSNNHSIKTLKSN